MATVAETRPALSPSDHNTPERTPIEEGMWDLEGHFGYSGVDDPKIQEDIDAVKKDFEIWKETLRDRSQVPKYDDVAVFLTMYESLQTRILGPHAYARMKTTANIHDEDAMHIRKVGLEIWNTVASTVNLIINEYKKHPQWDEIVKKLQEDGWRLDMLARSKESLTEEILVRYNELQQKILANVQEYDRELSKIAIDVSGTGKASIHEAIVLHGTLVNAQDRREMMHQIVHARERFSDSMIGTLLECIASHRERAELLKYPDAMALSFSQMHIPLEAYESLVRIAKKYVGDYWLMYDRILSNILHIPLSKLRYDDTVSQVIPKRDVPFGDAIEEIAGAWDMVHADFGRIIRDVYHDKRILWKITPDRSTQLYMWHAIPGLGPFLSVRYDGGARARRSLAHELGHAIHATHIGSCKKQLFHGFEMRYRVTEEILSLFSESLYQRSRIDATQNPEQKAQLILSECGGWFDQVFSNIRDTEFEKTLHAYKSTPSAEVISQLSHLFSECLNQWFEPSLGREELQNAWIMHSMYYREPFKLCAYAISRMIALSLIQQYEEAKETGTVGEFVGKLKIFMTAGGSKDPQKLLRDSFGIELEPELYEKGFQLIDKRLKEASALLDQSELIESTTGLASQGQALRS